MYKAGQFFNYKDGVFYMHHDTAEIKGTLTYGTYSSSTGGISRIWAYVDNLTPFKPTKQNNNSTLEFKIKVDTSELDAAIAKAEKLLELQVKTKPKWLLYKKEIAGTLAKPEIKKTKVYTKNDLYIGLTFPYAKPYDKNGYYYKITGFKGDDVILDEFDKNDFLGTRDYEMTIALALERLNQE